MLASMIITKMGECNEIIKSNINLMNMKATMQLRKKNYYQSH